MAVRKKKAKQVKRSSPWAPALRNAQPDREPQTRPTLACTQREFDRRMLRLFINEALKVPDAANVEFIRHALVNGGYTIKSALDVDTIVDHDTAARHQQIPLPSNPQFQHIDSGYVNLRIIQLLLRELVTEPSLERLVELEEFLVREEFAECR